MSNPFGREIATERFDMPHQYADGTGYVRACAICNAGMDDVRHRAWEQMQVATSSREEAAQDGFTREVGS